MVLRSSRYRFKRSRAPRSSSSKNVKALLSSATLYPNSPETTASSLMHFSQFNSAAAQPQNASFPHRQAPYRQAASRAASVTQLAAVSSRPHAQASQAVVDPAPDHDSKPETGESSSQQGVEHSLPFRWGCRALRYLAWSLFAIAAIGLVMAMFGNLTVLQDLLPAVLKLWLRIAVCLVFVFVAAGILESQ
jgi:hypothetical protein